MNVLALLHRKITTARTWRAAVASWYDVIKLAAVRATGRGGGLLARCGVSIRLADGKKPVYLRCASSDFATWHEIFVKREYESILRYAPASVQGLLDLGANVGLASRWFLVQWPSAFVLAVEPDRENCNVLNVNLSNFTTCDGGYKVVAAFIGATARTAFLATRGQGWANEGTLAETPATSSQPALPVMTPQQVMAMCPYPIDVVKIDIEGGEKELCEGELSWLAQCAVLVMEIHAPLDEKWVREALMPRLPGWTLQEFECRHAGAYVLILTNSDRTCPRTTPDPPVS